MNYLRYGSKMVSEYIDAYPEVGVFLPIVYETDENGQFISFTNESVWAKEFTEVIGMF